MQIHARRGLGQDDSGLTTDQQQALCNTSSNTTWDPTTNTCVVTATGQPTGSLTTALPQAGVTSCPNNTYPGTPSDVNCPWWCLFTDYSSSMFPACTPCVNQCPTGTVWDTTNNICTTTPATTNCLPTSQASAVCPAYCNIPLVNNLFSACAHVPRMLVQHWLESVV